MTTKAHSNQQAECCLRAGVVRLVPDREQFPGHLMVGDSTREHR